MREGGQRDGHPRATLKSTRRSLFRLRYLPRSQRARSKTMVDESRVAPVPHNHTWNQPKRSTFPTNPFPPALATQLEQSRRPSRSR